MIKLIPYNQIDFEKYDSCVLHSEYPSLYAMSWYLDITAKRWSVFVLGDYEAVMPIYISSKFLIRKVIQPLLNQKLGIFSKKFLTDNENELFYNFLASFLILHYTTQNKIIHKDIEVQECANFVLSLSESYSNIKKSYSTNCLRNISKIDSLGIMVSKISKQQFVMFMNTNPNSNYTKVLKILPKYLETLDSNAQLQLTGAYVSGVLEAVLCSVWYQKRIYILIPASSNSGKENKAMFLLIDTLIKKFANSNLTIDFEGSEIDGVARFYKGFGAQLENYYYNKKRIKLFF